ncbi:dTDP-4-amino-4,6-dideoxygalactose transaminase [Microcella putealis]|uniref:dTDP-4-amino-4,6-dideoxygalactose transaminase n=1 Tax=Microcella putealis TaxID=337005 RepID=A0A4Q7LRB5_9MICO|nr:DegT/DnrJ/EryC1/StrS family aminotransferase [Microcella putealis]RZS57416.1 dTDP-4-amino-4,6-dideoxygalactose transaminase [Microcella putealis]TQM19441.1 dTDP-4-amino-4,6-dideoxygalactose transaminase [Microcella putealis]
MTIEAPRLPQDIWSTEPFSDTPLHVGRPNVGDTEAFLELAQGIFDRRILSNNGPLVRELERQIERRLGVDHCVLMANGTVALEIAIVATGMRGEVIVPSYTFVATAHAVRWLGLTPVFADIDPETHTLSADAARRRVTRATGGIIGVHLWGQGADVGGIGALASELNIPVIYDAAHSFDSMISGKKIGAFGNAEVFSFHATKFFNTFEGGAVTTNDPQLADRLRLMRNFGFDGEDSVIHLGTNAKMTEICAAMGLINLQSIDAFVMRNRENYRLYESVFSTIPFAKLLSIAELDESNAQYVVVEIQPEAPRTRDDIVTALRAANVLARRYFWPGAHQMEPYRSLYPTADQHLPNTREVADRVVVLPTGTSVGAAEIQLIGDVFQRAFGMPGNRT